MNLHGPMARPYRYLDLRRDAEDLASLLVHVTRGDAGNWFVVSGHWGQRICATETEAKAEGTHIRGCLIDLLIDELPRLAHEVTPQSFAAYLTQRGWVAGTSKRPEILRFHPPQDGRHPDDFNILIPATTDLIDYAECVLRAAGCLRQIEGRPIGDILRDASQAAPAQEGDQHVQAEG